MRWGAHQKLSEAIETCYKAKLQHNLLICILTVKVKIKTKIERIYYILIENIAIG